MAAGHPVPDENGLQAGLAVQKMLARTTRDDAVLVLVSGGGSALVPAPVPGVTLDDKAQVNRLLLGAGLDITEMNMVRQHLSRLKGGGLLHAAAPAPVTALILSDVIGDDLRVIASGPTVAPIGTRAEAMRLLEDHGLWAEVPASVRAVLRRDDTPRDLPEAANHLVGSNAQSVAAVARALLGAQIDPVPLLGDVAEAAARIVALTEKPRRDRAGGRNDRHLARQWLGRAQSGTCLARGTRLAGPSRLALFVGRHRWARRPDRGRRRAGRSWHGRTHSGRRGRPAKRFWPIMTAMPRLRLRAICWSRAAPGPMWQMCRSWPCKADPRAQRQMLRRVRASTHPTLCTTALPSCRHVLFALCAGT